MTGFHDFFYACLCECFYDCKQDNYVQRQLNDARQLHITIALHNKRMVFADL